MKFLSFKYKNVELYGVKVKKEEKVWNIIDIIKDFDDDDFIPSTLREAIEVYGIEFIEKIRLLLSKVQKSKNSESYKISLSDIIWRAPIIRPPKNIFCVGHNYPSLIKEIKYDNIKTPKDIIIFTKVATSVAANNEIIPSHKELTDQLDYEGELAVVIAKKSKNILKPLALDYVFGYTIINDITAHDMQYKHGQFFLGKSLEKSAIIGPYLVTKDEFSSPESMNIITKVNGEIRQNSSTSEMLFRIDDLLTEISKVIPFEACDIIATGTPAGIGSTMNPPQFLKKGDEIKISIDGIGTLTNIIGD